MIKLHEAIKAINPQAEFTYNEEDFSTIKWLGGTSAISQSDVEAKQTELQADYDAKQYQRDRIYPSIQDQLDMQYWDSVNGTTTWKDTVAKVKADNPKD